MRLFNYEFTVADDQACQTTAAFLHERYQELSKVSGNSRKPLPWPRSR